MIKFYFAGAIRGGREKTETFIRISELLKQYGIVLDEHVANPNVNKLEQNVSLGQIYKRDISWIDECDIVVAEVSTPSLGVGYEICYAECKNIPIITLYDKSINVSAMIRGNSNLILVPYENDEELLEKLRSQLDLVLSQTSEKNIGEYRKIYKQ